MKKIINILLILTLLALLPVEAQNLPRVCTGSTVRYGVSGMPNSLFNWEVEGGVIVNNYNDSVDVRWSNQAGRYQLQVVEITDPGLGSCMGEVVEVQVEIGSANVSLGSDRIICLGENTYIDAGSNFSSYLWSDGSIGHEYMATNSGYVWVEVTDADGCKGYDTIYVDARPLPNVHLGRDTTLCPGEYLELRAENFGSMYEWKIIEGAEIQYQHTQGIWVVDGEKQIILAVTDSYGCTGYDTLNIASCDINVLQETIPNAFTPNDDGKNDTWIIDWIERYPNAQVEIFDRWGRLVFRANNGYSNDWDGRGLNGRDLPMDTYYYVIDLKDGRDKLVGFVTIVR